MTVQITLGDVQKEIRNTEMRIAAVEISLSTHQDAMNECDGQVKYWTNLVTHMKNVANLVSIEEFANAKRMVRDSRDILESEQIAYAQQQAKVKQYQVLLEGMIETREQIIKEMAKTAVITPFTGITARANSKGSSTP